LLYNLHFLTRRFDDWLAGARESWLQLLF